MRSAEQLVITMPHEPQFTVLLVDGERENTVLLSRVLQRDDLRIISTRNGQEALSVLARQSVDAVLSDIHMKGMSGFELMDHVRQLDSTITFIMMSDCQRHETIKGALQAHAFDYLSKPLIDHAEIVRAVRQATAHTIQNREHLALIKHLEDGNVKVNAANERLLQLNKQLRKLAVTDSLTQLYNRRFIDDWIQNRAFSNASLEASYSVMLLDIDHFKSINDNFGHDGGDKVLKHLASVLRRVNRPDDLVGRYGGEEFIIVMPGSDEVTAVQAAEELRATIEATTIDVGTDMVSITASIGVSTHLTAFSSDGSIAINPAAAYFSSRSMVAQADKALYVAKDRGRNLSLHYSELPETSEQESRAA